MLNYRAQAFTNIGKVNVLEEHILTLALYGNTMASRNGGGGGYTRKVRVHTETKRSVN